MEKYTNYRGTVGNVVQGDDKNRKFVFADKDNGAEILRDAEWVAT
jgi:hypothetical protein